MLAARILDLLSFTPAVNHASRTIHYSNLPNEATIIMTLGVHPPIADARTLLDPAGKILISICNVSIEMASLRLST
jgi:hypothetical protein